MNASARLSLGVVVHEPLQLVSDEELARRADADSFAVLYQRHLPAVYRYLAGRLSSPQEAEDQAGDVFRQAWINRTTYRGRGSFRAWIFTIVRRTLADYYRQHKHIPAAPSTPDKLQSLLDQAAS